MAKPHQNGFGLIVSMMGRDQDPRIDSTGASKK
jgi:hypothetical protein